MPSDLRSRKRVAMRQNISNAATRLFLQHGFEQVTVDQIAAAADVGRMTVFNHFPRKEDMFFDRDEEARELLRQALAQRDPAVSPVETLRLLAHRLVAEGSPQVSFSEASQGFVRTIQASESLKARARAIRDEIALELADALAQAVDQTAAGPQAHLAAGLLSAGWTVALTQAHLAYGKTRNAAAAQALFLALIDKATVGVRAALAGTSLG